MSLRSRRRRRGGHGVPEAKVDMNSLIDLTFLLLVTFIITLPDLVQGITVKLPQAKADALPSKEKKANTITIQYPPAYYFNEVKLDRPEDVEPILRKLVAEDPDVPVLVRGDKRLDYGTVMDVVKIVYKCQARRMALVTVEK